MATIWFLLVAAMLTAYVVLDGFDLGVGAIHLVVARSEDERRQVLQAIGPVWDGNEVWLIAGAGTLYFAFPRLYATAFSGFYLPLMIVLWLLIVRAVGIELRSHVPSPVWKQLWDVLFSAASALLAVLFGAAMGNVVRGVALDDGGTFFHALWTDFTPTGSVGILDWYTVSVALFALVALSVHGSAWLVLKTTGPVRERAERVLRIGWPVELVLAAVVTAATFRIQPQVAINLGRHPVGWVLPTAAVVALALLPLFLRRGRERGAFLASCTHLIAMMGATVFGLYPQVLPALDRIHSLTIANAAAPETGLVVGLWWWTPGILLVVGWFVLSYRTWTGKVEVDDAGY